LVKHLIRDAKGAARIDAAAWICEVRVIENVEEISLEFKINSFCEADSPSEGEIHLRGTKTTD